MINSSSLSPQQLRELREYALFKIRMCSGDMSGNIYGRKCQQSSFSSVAKNSKLPPGYFRRQFYMIGQNSIQSVLQHFCDTVKQGVLDASICNDVLAAVDGQQ